MSYMTASYVVREDRNVEMSSDEPRGYPPIRERPENTHIGWGGDDPAAVNSEKNVATFDPTE